jgi:hypothetical protein
MARTDKDRPYAVRAKEASKGIIKHHRYCNGLPHRWSDYTDTKTHIFHANEVKEMNAVKEAAAEAGAEVKITEKSGYLVSYNPNTHWDFVYGRPVKPYVREKVVTKLDGPRGDNLVSKFDVFYIIEVSTKRYNKNEDACCGAVLPKSETSKSGCPCCNYPEERGPSKARVRDELVGLRKEFNAR